MIEQLAASTSNRATQLGLLDREPRGLPIKEHLKTGTEAIRVIEELFTCHTIHQFSYTEYDPEMGYPLDHDPR